jgi:MATE family multidrug resistance protein
MDAATTTIALPGPEGFDRMPRMAEILRFTGPLVLGLLTYALHSVIDTLFVGRLGTAEVAAVGMGSTFYFAGLVLFLGLMRNSVAFTARAYGARRWDEIGPIAAQYQWLALLAAPLLWLLVLAYPWIAALGQFTPEVEVLGRDYLCIRLLSVPLVLTIVLYGALYQATGRAIVPMAVAWSELALKTVLNELLIFGHGGFPALGVSGAAWATVLGELVSVTVIAGLVHLGPLRAQFRLRILGAPRLALLWPILAVGIPQGLGDAIEVATYLCFFAILGRLGEATLAANNIAIVTTQVLFIPAFALGIAAASYMGRFLGAGHPEIAVRTTWRVLALGVVYMGVLGVPLWSFGADIAGLYSQDAEVVRLAALAFKVMAVYQVCDGAGIILRLTLGGAGDTRVPTLIMAASSGLIMLPGGWWLSQAIQPGIVGGWVAAFIHMTVLAALLWWRFQRGAWRALHLGTAAAERP